MTLKDFLKQDGIDVATNSSPQANEIKIYLKHRIDFSKDINDLTDDEIYEVFHTLYTSTNKGKVFSYDEIVERVKELFKTIKTS